SLNTAHFPRQYLRALKKLLCTIDPLVEISHDPGKNSSAYRRLKPFHVTASRLQAPSNASYSYPAPSFTLLLPPLPRLPPTILPSYSRRFSRRADWPGGGIRSFPRRSTSPPRCPRSGFHPRYRHC